MVEEIAFEAKDKDDKKSVRSAIAGSEGSGVSEA